MVKRVLCFGDSNTWGYVPAKGTRYPSKLRWTGVAARRLGEEFTIIEDSISGRTTIYEDDQKPNRCGIKNLGYTLLAQFPLDLVILFLGTNDLKFTDVTGYQRGICALIDTIYQAEELFQMKLPAFQGEKKILLVAPPVIAPEIETIRPDHQLAHAAGESRKLQRVAAQMAQEKGTWFLDASLLVSPSLDDCLHLSQNAHQVLGNAIADKVLQIFQTDPQGGPG
ncbi:MAG: hypothetical protein HFF50_10280 [Lawsonibacter sp.]|nr:hypothetical protein [Lawsonibacter sp.]